MLFLTHRSSPIKETQVSRHGTDRSSHCGTQMPTEGTGSNKPPTSGENPMTLQYRGVPYTSDHQGTAVSATPLVYRGKQYTQRQSGSCRKVNVAETYRGIQHNEVRTFCV